MSNLVNISIENGIAHVLFNRPEKMNALNIAMFEAITNAGKRLQEDKSVRVVVLSGEGRAFCAGLDLGIFTDPSGFKARPLGSPDIGKAPNFYQEVAWIWKQVPVPVIAALHGVAFGGGLQIALGADIRYAHPETKLSVMEARWGLIPDMSGTQTLRDLVRLDVAKELCFTGRIVLAPEAREIGLVTRVVDDPLAEAMKTAKEISSKNPDAMAYDKKILNESWNSSYEEGLLQEEKLQAELLGSPNQLEAVMSAMQKRDPKFNERE